MTNIGIAMAPDTLYRLAPPLIALQFAAFGWRVNREINLGDAGWATWVPIPDVLNIVSVYRVQAPTQMKKLSRSAPAPVLTILTSVLRPGNKFNPFQLS